MKRTGGSMMLAGLALTLVAVQAAPARAFCGFYVGGAESSLFNDATMVVMMREGTRTVLSMQNNYQGPPEDFAMVVPVPVVLSEDNVKTLPREVFSRVDRLAAPRLVEYWETDPCYTPPPPPEFMRRSGGIPMPSSAAVDESADDLGVTVEAEFSVAEYDIVILSANDSSGLDTWLRREGYHIPDGAEPALRPYVQSGTKFFVAKVDVERVTFRNGRATLSPLRVHYESDEFSLPVRLGMINSSGTQDLIVHVLAPGQRYETANYPNVFIPTNIEVADSVRENFGAFYAALFDRTLEVNRGAVVTEYSWRAGSCDPCPGPTLTDADILTLGGDVITGQDASQGRRGWGALASQYTLTRMHYRYGRGELGEDLVFRAAPGVIGGRGVPDVKGVMDQTVQPASMNNFQGRYAILHRWDGPIDCRNPIRGRWGGPPGGAAPTPRAATDLGSQRRGGVQLQSSVAVPVPSIQVTPGEAIPSSGSPPEDSAPTEENAETTETSAASTEGSGRCSATPGPASQAGLFLLLAALSGLLIRRRA